MPSGRFRIGFPPPGTYRLNVDTGLYTLAGTDAPLSQDTGSVQNPFKFTPGHYLMFDQGSGGGTTEDKQDLMQDFTNESNLVGFFLKERWKNLESNTQGNYTAGFALIDSYLDALPPGKKFILGVRDQLFGGTVPTNAHGLLPTYLDAIDGGPYLWPGGAAWSGSLTIQAQVDVEACMDAYIAMYVAYAARYDGDDRFEMMSTGETSIAVPSSQGFSYTDYKNQLKRFAQEARAAWTRTPIRIATNYIGSYAHMQEVIDTCVDYQIAIGGPDTMPREDRIFWDNEVYLGLEGSTPTDYRGSVPRVAAVDGTELGGYLGNYTPAQIWNDASYGHVNMRPTHWLWYHNLPGRNPDSTAATQWGNGTTQGILWWIRNNPLTIENTINPYGGGGNPPPDPGGEGPIEIVGVSSPAIANNAAVTPTRSGTVQNGDVDIVVATIRAPGAGGRTLTCTGYTTLAVYGLNSQSPLYIFAKDLTAGAGNPTVTPVGGGAGEVVQAAVLLLRNTKPVAEILHTAHNQPTSSASSTNPIVTPAGTITEDNCLVLMANTYPWAATTYSDYNPDGGGVWTRDIFSPTTTGNDQTMAVWHKLHTTATNISSTTISMTGGGSGTTRTTLIALKGA